VPKPAALTAHTRPHDLERIESLDALRGVAVLGIFVINILGFGLGEVAFSNPILSGGDGWLNNGLWSAANVFVNGSMRGLFSLLFGAGIVLFTSRAVYPDGPIRVADLYFRRTFLLILLGLIHSFIFLGPGDILLIYGIAGVILFPFRILRPKTLMHMSLAILAMLTLDALNRELPETALGHRAAEIQRTLETTAAEPSEEERAVLGQWQEIVNGNWPDPADLAAEKSDRTGDVATVFLSNAIWVKENSQFLGIVWWVTDAMLLMFLGMALFKWGVLTNEKSWMFYVRLGLIGYAIGLGLRTFWLVGRWQAEFSPILWAWSSFDQVARLAVTMGHIGAFFCIWKIASNSLLLRGLVATGRMALTNYLGQTIIANILFSGIGFGLYMTFTIAELFGTMLAIWVAQILFSAWWLARFRFGPFEWIWRSLTYGKAPVLRRD